MLLSIIDQGRGHFGPAKSGLNSGTRNTKPIDYLDYLGPLVHKVL